MSLIILIFFDINLHNFFRKTLSRSNSLKKCRLLDIAIPVNFIKKIYMFQKTKFESTK